MHSKHSLSPSFDLKVPPGQATQSGGRQGRKVFGEVSVELSVEVYTLSMDSCFVQLSSSVVGQVVAELLLISTCDTCKFA